MKCLPYLQQDIKNSFLSIDFFDVFAIHLSNVFGIKKLACGRFQEMRTKNIFDQSASTYVL